MVVVVVVVVVAGQIMIMRDMSQQVAGSHCMSMSMSHSHSHSSKQQAVRAAEACPTHAVGSTVRVGQAHELARFPTRSRKLLVEASL